MNKKTLLSKLKNLNDNRSQLLFFSFAILLLIVFCILPFLNLFIKIVFIKDEWTLKYVLSVFEHKGALRAFKNTAILSISIAILSTALALPIGWLLSRTEFPYAKKLRSLFCLPYAIPPYVGAMAWIYLANPTTGIINQLLGFPLFNIYSHVGLVWVESTFLYTFVLVSVLTSLDRMDSSYEEAARLSGASPRQVFFNITLPLLGPSLRSSMILVGLAAAASFGVPALIGSPAKIYLVTTQIYTFQKMGSMKGIYQACALSFILLLCSLLLLYVNHLFLKNKKFKFVSGKSAKTTLIDLGLWKWPLFALLILSLFILFFLPVLSILFTSLNQSQGVFNFNNLGLSHFKRVFFETSETGRSFWNSFSLATISASLAAILALFLSYIQWKTKIKGRGLLEISASFPYSIPGTVVGLALILSFSRGIFGIGPSLYNTLTILWLAYLIKYLSLAMKTIGDGYCQIDDSLAEAARVSGASWLTTMKSIWLPLLKPSIIAAWFLIFMPAFSELTMTILLSGPGTETLGTLIFQLQDYADPSGGSAAVLALVVIFVVVFINFIVKWFSNGKYGL